MTEDELKAAVMAIAADQLYVVRRRAAPLPADLRVGGTMRPDPAVWLYTPSKGWGYTFRVPCLIVGSGRARKKIVAMTERGELRIRQVKREHLSDEPTRSEAEVCKRISVKLELDKA